MSQIIFIFYIYFFSFSFFLQILGCNIHVFVRLYNCVHFWNLQQMQLHVHEIMFLIRACSYVVCCLHISINIETLCVSILRRMTCSWSQSCLCYSEVRQSREQWNALTEQQRNAGLLEQVISFWPADFSILRWKDQSGLNPTLPSTQCKGKTGHCDCSVQISQAHACNTFK